MGNDSFNIGKDHAQSNLREQLEVLRVKYENEQHKLLQKEQELNEAVAERNKLRVDLKELREVTNVQEVKLEVTKEQLKHANEAISQYNKTESKKKRKIRALTIITTMLFFLASLLLNYGNSLITSNPPNISGILVLSVASAMYILAAVINILIVGEER